MKTKKLLFTILITCISFIGMSKNNDPLLTVGVEDDMFGCNPQAVSNLKASTVSCAGAQNIIRFEWDPSTASNFYGYEYRLLDQYNNPLIGPITMNSNSAPNIVLLVNKSIKVVKFKVRVISRCGYSQHNNMYIYKKGPYKTYRYRIIDKTAPITSVAVEGIFCSGNTLTFIPIPNSSRNVKYHWVVDFGGGLPLKTDVSTNVTPAASFVIPGPYSHFPVHVSVKPENACGYIGATYDQVFTPATPAILDISSNTISTPLNYCPGRSNTFGVQTSLISGLQYKWTFYSIINNNSQLPIEVEGFEMTEFNPNFGSGSPTGTGTVTDFNIELQVSTGCKPWSDPIETGWTQVSYNCNPINPIYSRSSVSGHYNNARTQLFDINIYPNPSTSGIFNINVSGLEGDKTIDVMDLSGKLVYKTSIMDNHSKIDLSNHSKGMYFVKVSDGVHQNTQKIIF